MNCIGVGLLINPGTLLEDSYMRNIIVTIIFLLTLVAANGVVAKPVNECIACQNRCAKKFPGLGNDYSNCRALVSAWETGVPRRVSAIRPEVADIRRDVEELRSCADNAGSG